MGYFYDSAMQKALLPLLAVLAMVSTSRAIEPVGRTNYKCGIDLILGGEEGKDWVEEYLYHDRIVTDRRVIYIRDTTQISFAHNDLNSVANMSSITLAGVTIFSGGYYRIIGKDGPDLLPNTGDEGLIRMRVDRDQQDKYKWSFAQSPRPYFDAYSGPFDFADLSYEPGIPVVGTTGPNGALASSRTDRYFRGVLDDFGDEWHTISIADDDEQLLGPQGQKEEYLSSDGRVFLFVVNPQTPAITVRATGTGQFYTTPAKAYWTPKIHSQTTYFQTGAAGDVIFEICNLYDEPVFYRIVANGLPAGNFINAGAKSVVLNAFNFPDGASTLEYYYKPGKVKARKIVKNPGFPSAGEAHGNLIWGTEADWAKIVARLNSVPYADTWKRVSTNNNVLGYNFWDVSGLKGLRRPWVIPGITWGAAHPSQQTCAFANAFSAKVLGMTAKRTGKTKSYANYAKEMLLDNSFTIDPLGWETLHVTYPHPSTEVIGAGYYMVNAVIEGFPAYDILIANYRSDQYPGGITPIEDYFIRDSFASYVFNTMMLFTGVGTGMWDTASDIGSLMVAIGMPSYSTPYYGTSGFDGTTTTYPWCPWPDSKHTWKQVLLDANVPTPGFPNVVFNWTPQTVLWAADGNWIGKVDYASSSQMGHCYYTYSNLIARYAPRDQSRLIAGYKKLMTRTLRGTTDSHQIGDDALQVVNPYFPALIPFSNPEDLQSSLNSSGVWGLAWYNKGVEPAKGNRPNRGSKKKPLMGPKAKENPAPVSKSAPAAEPAAVAKPTPAPTIAPSTAITKPKTTIVKDNQPTR